LTTDTETKTDSKPTIRPDQTDFTAPAAPAAPAGPVVEPAAALAEPAGEPGKITDTAAEPSHTAASGSADAADAIGVTDPARNFRAGRFFSATSTFRSLNNRNYRIYAAGQLVSNTGTWMARIAQDWLVLTITHSGTALGLVTALQFLPILLLSMWGGALADRFPKRILLMCTQSVMGVLSIGLGLLTVSGVVTEWQIYLFALVLGTVTALDTPARQSFVVEMVGTGHLQNAVSLNSANFNLARVIGPTVSGVMIGLFSSEILGTGWVFLVNAASFTAVVLSLLALRTADLRPAKAKARGKGQLTEGLQYVRTRKDLLAVFSVVLIFGTFGLNFPVLLPLFTTQVFHSGASAYGILSGVMAVGSLTGALLAARRKRAQIRVVVAGAFAFGILEALASIMPGLIVFSITMVIVGLAGLTVATTANAVVQTSVDPELRGRVLGIYLLVFMGGTPLGSPLVGWLAGAAGVRWACAFCGLVTAFAAIFAARRLARATDRKIETSIVHRPHITVVPRTA
jgi:MFS family permease